MYITLYTYFFLYAFLFSLYKKCFFNIYAIYIFLYI